MGISRGPADPPTRAAGRGWRWRAPCRRRARAAMPMLQMSIALVGARDLLGEASTLGHGQREPAGERARVHRLALFQLRAPRVEAGRRLRHEVRRLFAARQQHARHGAGGRRGPRPRAPAPEAVPGQLAAEEWPTSASRSAPSSAPAPARGRRSRRGRARSAGAPPACTSWPPAGRWPGCCRGTPARSRRTSRCSCRCWQRRRPARPSSRTCWASGTAARCCPRCASVQPAHDLLRGVVGLVAMPRLRREAWAVRADRSGASARPRRPTARPSPRA